jgi:hypothetical protein
MDGTADAWISLSALLGSAVVFLGIWFASLQVLSRWGGWKQLADHYPPSGILGSGVGESFRFRSLTLRNGANYNNCVSLMAGPSALRLSMPWLFSAGHAPIEVPWSEIRSEAGRVWWYRVVTLRFARAPSVPLHVRPRLAAGLARASGGQLALPPEAAGR